jgi:hypothetical protein
MADQEAREGAMRMDGQPGPAKASGGFSRGIQGHCGACGASVPASRRGSPRRWCDRRCRRQWETEVRRAGEKALRRRLARAAKPPPPPAMATVAWALRATLAGRLA